MLLIKTEKHPQKELSKKAEQNLNRLLKG